MLFSLFLSLSLSLSLILSFLYHRILSCLKVALLAQLASKQEMSNFPPLNVTLCISVVLSKLDVVVQESKLNRHKVRYRSAMQH